MEPTIKNGDKGLSTLLGLDDEVKRGDIVVIEQENFETGGAERWIKRVIGLSGETIEARDDDVKINGKVLDESDCLSQDYMDSALKTYKAEYANNDYGPFTYDFGPVTLGDDEYWLMGDSRINSLDSRSPEVGPIHRDEILATGFRRLNEKK